MPSHQQDGENEQNKNGTPSTASRVKPAAIESIFPTPARRETTGSTSSQKSGRASPAHGRISGVANNASSTPQKHKSIEALRSQASRAFSNGRSSSTDPDKPWQRRGTSKKN
ncbi:hypothetical protein H2198_003322, partial [Neophaeococcomyces mojaviensis]